MPKLAPLNFPQYKAYPYFQKCSFPNFFFSSALTCPIIPHHPSRPPPCPHHRPAYTHLPFSSPFPSPLSFPSPFFSFHFPCSSPTSLPSWLPPAACRSLQHVAASTVTAGQLPKPAPSPLPFSFPSSTLLTLLPTHLATGSSRPLPSLAKGQASSSYPPLLGLPSCPSPALLSPCWSAVAAATTSPLQPLAATVAPSLGH